MIRVGHDVPESWKTKIPTYQGPWCTHLEYTLGPKSTYDLGTSHSDSNDTKTKGKKNEARVY